ncbi:MAG: signal peptidase I [Puniceicoccaceae bacterium]|nr:MAG: signal peptidase I [Puniceicoccaceae bacterium]
MFGLLISETRRARKNAANWLHLAHKVYHYRRDLMTEKDRNQLLSGIEELRSLLKSKADATRLKFAIEGLQKTLGRHGGTFYPKSSLVENVEFFLVALILFLGIRTYFIQPFKIPTNSMWPTYYGMTAEIFENPAAEPSALSRPFRFLLLGATRRTIDAPVDGPVWLPLLLDPAGTPQIPQMRVPARKWLVFPSVADHYVFYVGDNPQPVSVTVPAEFEMTSVIGQAFFGVERPHELTLAIRERRNQNRVREMPIDPEVFGRVRPGWTLLLIDTGTAATAGERILSFDVLTGDQLFVDRMSYHFTPPKVGHGFVFRTRNIPGLAVANVPDDKYYIKRLVGGPGDELEIREPVLYRNGAPIEGSPIFEKMATREGRFTGYVATDSLAPGRTVTLPEGSFYVLGDNSPNSLDSRRWGLVPEQDVVGRPLWIYYPFSKRWGPAR